MYDQTYDAPYGPPRPVGPKTYDPTYDQAMMDKRVYVATDPYGVPTGMGPSMCPGTGPMGPGSCPGGNPYGPSTGIYGTIGQPIGGCSLAGPGGRRLNTKMLVNVGGVRHEILWTTLEKFPNTRLGRLQECRTEDAILNYCDHYSYGDNEYFFDKNPRIFQSVISCYRNSKLHIPDEFCLTELVTELRYWGFDESFLDMCCQQKYRTRKMLYQEMKAEAESELLQIYGYQYGYDLYDDRFGIGQCAVYRKFLYDSFENPRFSRTTKVLPMISIIFSVLAVIAVALNSVESMKEKDKSNKPMDNVMLTRVIMVCVAWISIEYALRLCSSPNVTRFLFDGCNIIELLGCSLYFYTLIQTNKNGDRLDDLWKLYIMLRAWKVPNMICKLLYNPSVLQMDTAILSNFNKQFGILMLFFLTGMVMFATAIFTAEKLDPKTPFTSIPETFWYTIATLTTAGNTGVYPATTWGKYFGALCSVVGVLFLASVITISNFARVLQNISYNRTQNTTHNPLTHNAPGQMGYGAGPSPYNQPQHNMNMNMNPMNNMNNMNQMGYTNPITRGLQALLPSSMAGGGMQGNMGHPMGPMGGMTSSGIGTGNPGNLGARSIDENTTSYHHITFNDDLSNALGTIDVLVERDRKAMRESTSHTSNKVKTITFKVKFDPLGKPCLSSNLTGAGGAGSNAFSTSKAGLTTTFGPTSVVGPNGTSYTTTTPGGAGGPGITVSNSNMAGANDRAYPPALV